MSRRLLTLTRPLSGLSGLSSISSLPNVTTLRYYSSSFLQRGPAPPRLPADQQAEFERLQAAAEAALYTHVQVPENNNNNNNSKHVTQPSSSSSSSSSAAGRTDTVTAAAAAAGVEVPPPVVVIEDVAAQTFSGGIRKGAPPEFEGDKNPKTGEIGGPKNEPLRWGAGGDWSYNGRVTDF